MVSEQAPQELYDLVDVISGEFAGLELPLAAARERRRGFPRRAALVPVGYRTPQVSAEAARERAERVLRERQKDYPSATFEEVRLYASHPMVYTFVTLSPEWQQEGRVPGGLLCSVDKVDGHVWTAAEQEQYAKTNAGG
jgi:hypothetical protein